MLSNFQCPLIIRPAARRRTAATASLASELAGDAALKITSQSAADDLSGVPDREPSDPAPSRLAEHPYASHVNPHLAKLLRALALDKRFVQGEGSWLYDEVGDSFLDCVAAYGALPFGHNPSEIWDALQKVFHQKEPNLTQPSFLQAAGELARRLIELAPGDLKYVTFANSGAESVEAALKICRAATGRQRIVTMTHGFHGKTLGALSVTANDDYQDGFAPPTEHVVAVPFGDREAMLEIMESQGTQIAAILVEPIQGEAGIYEAHTEYLQLLRDLCDQHGAMLVFDEVQTGLGRTGDLFGCSESKVAPDVMTLAKALGGGLMPIGAVLANDRAYTEHFALKHSSTFAANTMACRAALATLDLLTNDDHALVEQVRLRGARLKHRLLQLQSCYPHLIEEVRGRGYMLGLQLTSSRDVWPDRLCGVIAEQGQLAPLLASYLLNVEGVRVAPTLNGKSVIRIEPPLNFTDRECDLLMVALERAMAVFNDGNTGRILSGVLLGSPLESPNPSDNIPNPVAQSPREGERRFAFLMHPLTATSFADFDPTISALPKQLILDISDRMSDLLEPFLVSRTRIRSATGEEVFGEFIAISKTAEELHAMPRKDAIQCVKEALEMARQRGAEIVGLGAFTSVVTAGGRSLKNEGLPLTTGNSYTAVACAESLHLAMKHRGQTCDRDTRAAIVGATGAIGRSMAMLLAEDVALLTLIGNPESRTDAVMQRLRNVALDVVRHVAAAVDQGFEPHCLAHRIGECLSEVGSDPETVVDILIGEGRVAFSQRIEDVADGHLVVAATSATNALLTADHLRQDAIVCDMSRPMNISREVADQRPDVLVIEGGVIAVPGCPSLGRIGLEYGRAFACMAETIMLTMEGRLENTSLGADISAESLQLLRRLARKHGFRVGELRSFGNAIEVTA